MSMLLTPSLRGPLEAFLASSPTLAGAAAGAAFVSALGRAQEDLEQGILQQRRVAAADAVAGPFDDQGSESVWGLVELTLRKFRGHHQPADLHLRSVEASVLAAENEVRLMGNAYTVETEAGEEKWVRACPIEPREAFEHIRDARRTAVRLLAAYALPQFARSQWGVAQSAELRQTGYHEPSDLHSSAPPRLCAGDKLADILDALARPPPLPTPLPGGDDGFEATAAARREAWLQGFKALTDSLPHMISIGDMRVLGAWAPARRRARRWPFILSRTTSSLVLKLTPSYSLSFFFPSPTGAPFIHVNPAFCRATGYSLEEVVQMRCNARFLQGPLTALGTAQFMADTIRNARQAHCKVLNYRKDGSTYINYMSLKPIFEQAPGRDSSGAQQWRLAFYLGLQYIVLPSDPPTRVLELEALLKSLPSEV